MQRCPAGPSDVVNRRALGVSIVAAAAIIVGLAFLIICSINEVSWLEFGTEASSDRAAAIFETAFGIASLVLAASSFAARRCHVAAILVIAVLSAVAVLFSSGISEVIAPNSPVLLGGYVYPGKTSRATILHNIDATDCREIAMNAQYRLIAEAVRAYGSPAGLKQVPADLCCPQGYIVPMKYPGNSGRSQFSVGAGLESGIAPCHYNPPSFPLLIGGNLENWPRYVQQLPYYTVSTPQEAAARWKADGMR